MTSAAVSIPSPLPWRALAAFAWLNSVAGILLLNYFGSSSVHVRGFSGGLFLLGVSYAGSLFSGGLLWKKDVAGLSFLKIVGIVNTGMCIVLRALLASDSGSVYRSAYMTSPNPGALARQWSESMSVLTLTSVVYASATAYLWLRFRQPLHFPQIHFPARAASDDKRIRRSGFWWLGVNSAGVSLSIFLAEYDPHGWYRHPDGGRHASYLMVWTIWMIALGALQVFAGSWLISLVKTRNKVLCVTLGVVFGTLSSLATTVLGAILVWTVFPFPTFFGEFHYGAEPLIGIYTFLFSGILFGAITARLRWLTFSQ